MSFLLYHLYTCYLAFMSETVVSLSSGQRLPGTRRDWGHGPVSELHRRSSCLHWPMAAWRKTHLPASFLTGLSPLRTSYPHFELLACRPLHLCMSEPQLCQCFWGCEDKLRHIDTRLLLFNVGHLCNSDAVWSRRGSRQHQLNRHGISRTAGLSHLLYGFICLIFLPFVACVRIADIKWNVCVTRQERYCYTTETFRGVSCQGFLFGASFW